MQTSSSSRHGARSPPPHQRRGPSRLQASSAAATGQQHRTMLRKPPEPLRRAVAECLSSGSYHSAESVRTFEDYLGSPSTIHFAYTSLLEHSLSERDRSPPVILRCVALLKRYLFRYVPPVMTLKQIDSFCTTLIQECSAASHKAISAKDVVPLPPPSVTRSVFATEGLVKSLVYIRAVVSRHLPHSSSSTSSQFNPLPSMRHKLLSPHYGGNGLLQGDGKQSTRPALTMLGLESVDDANSDFIAIDVLKWRWVARKGRQIWVPSPVMMDSGGIARPQVGTPDDFLERGMALFFLDTSDTSYGNQLLRASKSVMGDAKIIKSHLQAVATSKRLPSAPSFTTLKKRPRPLFQYRCYSKQQPLRLSDGDIEDVIAAVCSDGVVQNKTTVPMVPSSQNGVGPETTSSIAASVLIKLIFDMYLADAKTAAPLTLVILQGMLSASSASTRVRAFDLVLNLGVHAHLLEPTLNSEDQDSSEDGRTPNAVAEFEKWLLTVLSEMLLFLVQLEEREEGVWAASMSTLLYLVCDRGRIRRQRLEAVDIRVLKALLAVSRENAWAQEIHSRLIQMLSNLVYRVSSDDLQPTLHLERLELIGGIETICREYEFPCAPDVRRNLFALILDYIVCELSNKKPSVMDDFQPVAASLVLAGAPESLGMAFRHKLPGVGGRLTKSITKALDRDISNGRLSVELLDEVARLLDTLVDKYASLEDEFSDFLSLTSTSGEDGHAVHLQGKEMPWTTLRSLLHSSRVDYRQAGYLWLSHLLGIEVQYIFSGEKDSQQSCLLKVFEQAKAELGHEETSAVLLLLELLNSKQSSVRQGFFIVLDRLLSQYRRAGYLEGYKNYPDQAAANRLVEIMNGALWQFISTNDTHRVNVLQMCNLMFSHICVRWPSQCDSENSKMDGDAVVSLLSSMPALLLRDGAAASKHLVSSMPTALFYWPLMQLAASTMDDITLSIAVGSGGGGNVPGGASDVRCALLLLLIGKCSLQQSALEEVGGEEFFRSLLDDTDARIAYYTASFLIKRMMVEDPDTYQRMLHDLVFKAQQSNNEKLLENPYLQLRGILQLAG